MRVVENYYQQFVRQFSSIENRNKIYILLILLFCMLVGLTAPFLYQFWFPSSIQPAIINTPSTPIVTKTSDIPKRPLSSQPNQNAHASLVFSSAKQTVQNGEQFDLSLILDSGTTNVEAADITVTYDPTVLTARKVIPGKYFGFYSPAKIDEGTVRISGMAYIKDNTLVIPRGRGTIATITFETKKAATQTTIEINRAKTLIASSSTGGKSILEDIQESVISIR